MNYLGDFSEDSTLYTFYSTNDGDGGRVGFSGALEAADFEVIKDGNATGSVAGITLDEDFDSRTGIHKITIDLSADAFYATGSDYSLLLYPDETVDSQSIAAVIAEWSIENRFMRGTDSANTTVPDAAGTAATPAEVATALTDIKLDHLVAVADSDDPVNNSIIAKLAASDGDWSGFSAATDALEAIRDRGDAEWVTGAGGSSPTVGEIRTEMETNGGKLDHLWETTEDDSGVRRFTENALEEAPSGTGGDATEAKQDTIIARLPTSLVSGRMSSDAVAISGDSTAADNLEAQFDGTGYTDDTAPSSRSQLAALKTGAAGVSTTASDYNLTTGTQSSGTLSDTTSINGVSHQHTDDGGTMDLYYEFAIGSGSPSEILVDEALTGNNDDLDVFGYDWNISDWVQVGELAGTVAAIITEHTYPLTVAMVGTAANLGKVRLRYYATALSTATLHVDRIWLAFNQGVGGYADGIEVDTNASNTNTVPGVDGVKGNPVSTWAAALTLSAATNIKEFRIHNGSAIELSANSDAYSICGQNWSLDLNGQSIEGLYVEGPSVLVTGIGTATVTPPAFKNVKFGAVTLPPCGMLDCGFGAAAGEFTAGSAGLFFMKNGDSLVAGSGSPVFNFAGNGASSYINNRGYHGGATYVLDSDCIMSHEVDGGGGTTVTTGGADIEIRGITRSLDITMSAAETVQFIGTTGPIDLSGTTTATVNLYGVSSTVTDTTSDATVTDRTTSTDNTWDEVLTASSHHIATSTGRRMYELSSDILLTGTSDGSNTSIYINLDSDASDVDGAYDPAVISIVGGTGVGQSRQIFEYNGTLERAYVNRDWKVIPDATSEYIITSDAGNTHVNEGLAQGGGASTITLNTLASGDDDAYNNQVVFLSAGVGADQAKVIIDYDQATKIATVDSLWTTQPTSGTIYVVLPTQSPAPSVANDILEDTGTTIPGLINGLTDVTAAEVRTAIEADNTDLDYLITDLINKKEITIANGNTLQYDDAGDLIGTITAAYTDDTVTVSRKAMRQVKA